MSLHVPELTFQIDPLIVEAKRRARRRRLIVLAALVFVVVAAGSLARGTPARPAAAGGVAGSGTQCTGFTTYGKQCIAVAGPGRRVTALQTSFDLTPLLYEHEWRIDLERYACDPIGRTKAKCAAASIWHGRARNSVRTPGSRYPDQVSFTQARSNGYWPAFALPHDFASNAWLCTEVAVYNEARGRWVYNASGLTRGLRACAAVHG